MTEERARLLLWIGFGSLLLLGCCALWLSASAARDTAGMLRSLVEDQQALRKSLRVKPSLGQTGDEKSSTLGGNGD